MAVTGHSPGGPWSTGVGPDVTRPTRFSTGVSFPIYIRSTGPWQLTARPGLELLRPAWLPPLSLFIYFSGEQELQAQCHPWRVGNVVLFHQLHSFAASPEQLRTAGRQRGCRGCFLAGPRGTLSPAGVADFICVSHPAGFQTPLKRCL